MRFLFWGLRLARIRVDAGLGQEEELRNTALARFARATTLWSEG